CVAPPIVGEEEEEVRRGFVSGGGGGEAAKREDEQGRAFHGRGSETVSVFATFRRSGQLPESRRTRSPGGRRIRIFHCGVFRPSAILSRCASPAPPSSSR